MGKMLPCRQPCSPWGVITADSAPQERSHGDTVYEAVLHCALLPSKTAKFLKIWALWKLSKVSWSHNMTLIMPTLDKDLRRTLSWSSSSSSVTWELVGKAHGPAQTSGSEPWVSPREAMRYAGEAQLSGKQRWEVQARTLL